MEQRKIRITFNKIIIEGTIFESVTASKIWNVLPIKSGVNLWGDEIYFYVDLKTGLDDTAKNKVNKGDIGYWPQGPAICLFFGPTPISKGNEIVPASKVNIIGSIEGELSALKKVNEGEKVLLEKI